MRMCRVSIPGSRTAMICLNMGGLFYQVPPEAVGAPLSCGRVGRGQTGNPWGRTVLRPNSKQNNIPPLLGATDSSEGSPHGLPLRAWMPTENSQRALWGGQSHPGTARLSLHVPVVLQVTCVQSLMSGQFLPPSGHVEALEGVSASTSLGICPTSVAGLPSGCHLASGELHWGLNGPWLLEILGLQIQRYLTPASSLVAPHEAHVPAEADLQQCCRDPFPSSRPWSHPTHPALALFQAPSSFRQP